MSRETFDGAGGAILPQIQRQLDSMATIIVNENYPVLASAFANTGEAMNSTKLEWQDYSPKALTVTTAAGAQDTTGDTAITCSADVSEIVFVGDQLSVDGTQETLLVTAVSSTNLTVTRGYGGTVKATIPSGTTLTIISQAGLEGQAYRDTGNYGATQRYNYTQLFDKGFEVSGSLSAIEFATALEGKNNQVAIDADLSLRHLLRNMASTILLGAAPASTTQGSASVRRTMNGIREMIREGAAAGTGAIYSNIASTDFNNSDAYDNLVAHIQAQYDLGKPVSQMVMNSRIATQLATNQKGGRQPYSESQAVRDFTGIQTPYGFVAATIDSFMPNDSLLLTHAAPIELRWLQPLTIEQMAKVGNSQRYQIVGECTIKVQDAATGGHSWLYGAAA